MEFIEVKFEQAAALLQREHWLCQKPNIKYALSTSPAGNRSSQDLKKQCLSVQVNINVYTPGDLLIS